ncbi:MAG: glycerophosphodiester phosphodiesterase family protein [Clostridia bacterium]|nr:glycerophosphodiester phosphodiesterase family protein [Clostridia bacterium]
MSFSIDFNQTIRENIKRKGSPLLVAHRGVCGANIPCNTITAYKIALMQGADIVEIDVSKSKDGVFYVFHPGMEHVFLKSAHLSTLTSSEIDQLRLYNQDSVITSYRVPRLKEVLELLKGKCYINVDKFWIDIEGISREIYECGVEKQVIVKTAINDEYMSQLKTFASDLMFMPLVWGKDEIVPKLQEIGVNVIGAEVLFGKESDDCISDEYIKSMHDRNLLVWVNSIIYNEADVISAHHTDDISFKENEDAGWGWLLDKGVDIIQTDWLLMLKQYIEKRQGK